MVLIAAALTASIGACQIAPVWAVTPGLAGESREASLSKMTGLMLSSQQPPVPKPFPQPGPPPPAAPPRAGTQPPKGPPATRSNPGQPEAAPTEATLGVPIYPGAQFLASYEAGRGQRYYIFGTAARLP